MLAVANDWHYLLMIPIILGGFLLISVLVNAKNAHQHKLWEEKKPEELTRIDGLFVGRPKKH